VNALRLGAAEALRAGLPPGGRLPAISTDALAQALVASLRFTAYPDVLPALAWAREHGLGLVVVSNWDSSLADVLDRIGVGEQVDGVVTSAGAGAAKPDPAIFRAALALVGVRAAQALHVGDSLVEDVAGARAAGVGAVWLDRAGSRAGCPPHGGGLASRGGAPTTISSLSELARVA
jgi:putative hydrolase of the HAD superfamily